MDKDNKITIKFENEDAKRFNEISKRTNWQDKFIVAVALRYYYNNKFKSNWEKAVIDALKEKEK